ncbi:hypothetical protein CERSUDRAFT_79950 [Gelatoporia subvermispora B]|uniref:Transmembrane protein 135 N-terminal domain-containing protein n=1 Tax=Ceriporiopsis subvermispora (strain B) TaxID=914234 RepID=M2QTA5_CERS8|nr:hypothetical protein CERSUDRAFT_79950 [Gelatoporia subvermispora B]
MSLDSGPPSPPDMSRSPSYIQFTPRRAMASFENLVALANYEEALREARKIVWRGRGEKPVEVQDLWECLEHASRGGLRAGSLAFAIRAGVNFFLLMTRIRKVPKKMRFALIRHAVFGPDSFRFAAMLGSFVAFYKFILNALPIFLPEPVRHRKSHSRSRSLLRASLLQGAPSDPPFHEDDNPLVEDDSEVDSPGLDASLAQGSRHARLSMSAQAHQVWVRKRTRRWYSVLAGAMAGGIAIMFEKRSRRVAIGQQMFVRGLQGTYNAFSVKRGFKIPHGDVILFSLCCGQIMYGWLLRPDTLPRSYNHWISTASKVPREAVVIARDLARTGTFQISDIESILQRKNLTESNRAALTTRLASALLPPPARDFGPPFGPCEAIHPWLDSCMVVWPERIYLVFRWMLPIYGALHFIPMLLFRRGRVLKEPVRMFMRAAFGTMRSSAFLGVFVAIYQGFFCGNHQLWTALNNLRTNARTAAAYPLLAALARAIPQSFLDLLLSKPMYWFLGVLAGLSLFVEDKHRREELAMYVLPKGLESAWVMARGKGLVFRTGEFGEAMLSAMGMGMVMSIYQNDPHHLSGLVRRILYQFVGPN